MRIISGMYKGKKLEGFTIDGTRPTMDRIKESMFAMIQDYIKDAIVLDLFAGSGSLGIEALSNYAKECYFVDNNSIAINTLKKNTQNVKNCNLIKLDFKTAINSFDIKFDLIFLDPPYYENIIDTALELIYEKDLLTNNGLIIVEHDVNIAHQFNVFKEKNYGNKKITILKK